LEKGKRHDGRVLSIEKILFGIVSDEYAKARRGKITWAVVGGGETFWEHWGEEGGWAVYNIAWASWGVLS